MGRLRRFGRGPINLGSWHVRDLRPPPERQPSRVERTYQRAARSCFVQDVVHSEHFRVVTPKSYSAECEHDRPPFRAAEVDFDNLLKSTLKDDKCPLNFKCNI